jgi:2-amino-4-hydroxy-6-hydroxymethyldihydropteridine diphosphokinase
MTGIAYIGLGSNLEEPVEQLKSALEAMDACPEIRVNKVSSFYRNPPMGPQSQPDYVNAVAELEVNMEAEALLDLLIGIENDHGRIRKGDRWGPRTLDLDILLFGEEYIESTRLTVPHPGIAKRPFVLKPLLEIAPDLVVPGLGSVEYLLGNCDTFWLEAIDDD